MTSIPPSPGAGDAKLEVPVTTSEVASGGTAALNSRGVSIGSNFMEAHAVPDTANADAQEKETLKRIDVSTRYPSIKPQNGFSDTLTYPDGGLKAWMVVCASFFTLFFSVGLQYCAGTYIRFYYYQETFGAASFTVLSFISSLNGAGFPIAGPAVGQFTERYGPRTSVLVGGVIAGSAYIVASFSPGVWFTLMFQGFLFAIGEVFIYMAAIRIVSEYFNRFRGLAVGLAVGGSGVGGLVMAVVTQKLLDTLGWQWALRIEGIIVVTSCVVASSLFSSFQPKNPPNTSLLASARSYFRDPRFLVLWISNAISFFGYFIPFSYLPSYATQAGIEPGNASLILGLTNGGSAVGRIVLGFLADKYGYLNVYVGCQIVTPVAMLFWPLTSSFGGLALIGMLYGFFAGGWISSQPTMLASVFGGDNLVARLGVIMSATLAGSLGGSPIAGAIADSRTTYDAAGAKAVDFVPERLEGIQMSKRKILSSEHVQDSDDESEKPQKGGDRAEEDGEEEKKSKKAKRAETAESEAKSSKSASGSGLGDVPRATNDDGSPYWKLTGDRRVTLSTYKGRKMVDIREYYSAAGGEMKPGKKGISLPFEQFELLKKIIPLIDAELEKAAK
ncbi:hypothetical protein HDU93_006521 [Gonapodya sp. JEL0774]|nr:hypothetical protein HDU93_006521 [Gonapodya sp. JEL0774]